MTERQAHDATNAMLDAIERLIEAQIEATPEARPALAARLARMFPEIAPKPQPAAADETGPMVWQHVKDLLAVLGRYRMTAADFEKRSRVLAHADEQIAAKIKRSAA